ncbi:hypothetical protein ISF_09924 [Cordyceps fumosorosea ARSEF 2679]|uniref:Uncharacterized protein n=1 Tax=Cordyceps fumosorosea (strain ARSEF 2679) TaxID=1081104 RepID=A0A166YYX1_CORFA|nr:hypothetical protein ISF_09924 [Cordyceps fumosorosea ARSEF 2679]OAA37375.1 hypothetical protein ISF_09924 [Cordyceps fumosorosea ARSEF 2679]
MQLRQPLSDLDSASAIFLTAYICAKAEQNARRPQRLGYVRRLLSRLDARGVRLMGQDGANRAAHRHGRERANAGEPQLFGYAPPNVRGIGFIAHNVLHVVAMLARIELLLWDEWVREPYVAEMKGEDMLLMDKVAAVIAKENVTYEDTGKVMEREGVKVPDTVMLYDPNGSDPEPVDEPEAKWMTKAY